MIDITNMTYLEISMAARAIDAAFSRALTAEYGVSLAGSRRYDDTKHDNAALESLKAEKLAWSDAINRKAAELRIAGE